MNKNLGLTLATTGIILAIAAGAWWLLKDGAQPKTVATDGPERPATIEETDPALSGTSAGTGAAEPTAQRRKPRATRVGSRDAILARDDLSQNEKDLLLAIDEATDAENLQDLLKLAEEAAISTNTEIRAEFVDALGWFGQPAMLDLMPFMADPDEEVAKSAMDGWTTALSDISSERHKCELVEKALKILSDEEALESMLLEVSDCDDLLVLQTLVNVIDSKESSAASTKVALEHYEFTTGEKYTTFEKAEAWLANNYEPPDDDDEKSDSGDEDVDSVKARRAARRAAKNKSGSSSSTSSTTARTSSRSRGGSSSGAAVADSSAETAETATDNAETLAETDEDAAEGEEQTEEAVEGEENLDGEAPLEGEGAEEEDEEALQGGAQDANAPATPAAGS